MKYVTEVIDPLVEALVHDLLTELPASPTDFTINWLQARSQPGTVKRRSVQEENKVLKREMAMMTGFVSEVGEVISQQGNARSKYEMDEESEEDDDDDDHDMEPPPAVAARMAARSGVSAEAFVPKKDFKPPVYFKTPEQKLSLARRISGSFLFTALEDADLDCILDAFEHVLFQDQERIITEGDDGDCLYIIEEGSAECKKMLPSGPKLLKKCAPGDVFGELALLYNVPRAASVEAWGRCLCWRLDRDTFNQVVKDAATKRADQYDKFLQNVSLFDSMEASERSRIVDALKVETYRMGDIVVRQSEPGDRVYIVEEGTLEARKAFGSAALVEKLADQKVVKAYARGDYFGELALLKNQPRAASVIVTSPTAKLVWLDRFTFNKMLGPLQSILSRRAASYT